MTLGTPVVGGPFYTQAASLYRRRGYDLATIEGIVAEREAMPLEVPVLAVYSRRDHVVAWRACVDRFDNPQVEHFEVATTHFGLLVAPESLRLVVDLLARPRESIAVRRGAAAGADDDR